MQFDMHSKLINNFSQNTDEKCIIKSSIKTPKIEIFEKSELLKRRNIVKLMEMQ